MPKLREEAVEKNQIRIEDAALKVFTKQGYHGTSVREIADAAGVSLGNIYNYYKTKEEIFESLVRRYGVKIGALQSERLAPLVGDLSCENLRRLAAFVRQMVTDNSDYWRLMYIDVVEFGNQHFKYLYHDFPNTLRRMHPGAFEGLETPAGVDPAVAFAALYLQFVTYYLVETLFGGKQHLGISEDAAIEHYIRMFCAGIGSQELTHAAAEGRAAVRSSRNATLRSGGADEPQKTGTHVRGVVAGAGRTR